MNAKNAADREKMYTDLLLVTANTIGYAEHCLHVLRSTALPLWILGD